MYGRKRMSGLEGDVSRGVEGLEGNDVIAVMEYPVRSGGSLLLERLILRGSAAPGLEVITSRGRTEILASQTFMKRDVSHSMLGDSLAVRLLTPFKTIKGEETVRQLQTTYLKRIIRVVADSIAENYELAAIHIRLHPRYFLLRWLKPKLAFLPSLARLFWWLNPEDEAGLQFLNRVEERIKEVLDEESQTGDILRKMGEFYALNPSRIVPGSGVEPKRVLRLPFNPQIVRVVKRPRQALEALRLILVEAQAREPTVLADLNPEEWAYIQTIRGLQRISQDEPLIEALKKHLSLNEATIQIDRRGSILNSTYLLRIHRDNAPEETLFVKRYFSWTDVKWVATKLWVMPLRNFYFSPTTRLSNEVFFLKYLSDKGFRVPQVVYLSWGEKVLVENAIDGYNLTEVWTKQRDNIGDDLLEKVTVAVGEMLAEVHQSGLVVGDCKPDNFMISRASTDIWLVDLEQASLRGDRAWDLSELILYLGHYLDLYEAERYASLIARGYLSKGKPEVVERALDGKFQLAMLPWTPIWIQVYMLKAVERELRR